MIVFGIILIVLGLLLPTLVPTFAFAHICVVIGIILLVVGLALMLWEGPDTLSAAAATTTNRPHDTRLDNSADMIHRPVITASPTISASNATVTDCQVPQPSP